MIEHLSIWKKSGRSRPACTFPLRAALGLLLIACACAGVYGQKRSSSKRAARATANVPEALMLRIVRAEDERRWDATLATLLLDKSAAVRLRAALAAGRIGDERAVQPLAAMLAKDRNAAVRAMAAFALGETESATAADALLDAIKRGDEASAVRARAVEALGKIAAALPEKEEERRQTLGETILNVLSLEAQPGIKQQREVVLEALTAALRAHPKNAGAVVAQFLTDADARVRADAANTLARLNAKDGTPQLRPKDGTPQLRAILMGDTDAVARANAARALGAAEDKEAFEVLVAHASSDGDERVRVSALRSLGALQDARAAAPLLQRGSALLPQYRAAKESGTAYPQEANELLEIATALGRLLANTGDARAIAWLRSLRDERGWIDPETEIAFARIAPAAYLRGKPFDKLADDARRAEIFSDWRKGSSLAQGLKEIAGITAEAAGNGVIGLHVDAQLILRALLEDARLPVLAAPEVLRALIAFKPNDASEVLRRQLKADDFVQRATAAELLGELPPDEANMGALIEALPVAQRDQANDAALSILDSLAKQKNPRANEAIKTALESADYLLRRRAASLLKANDAGDFFVRVGTVASGNTLEDYKRALARRNGRTRANVKTDKGEFVIELLPDDAPLTVDNFIQLARRGYWGGIKFHRVVPNFVVQGGDPRGDGNGGPGYQIRCEINEVEYGRGAVGMALSGKDTGGSQWFVTHSPQPHLDGGYTVFGLVEEKDMKFVDGIARGDRILSIEINEGPRPQPATGKKTPKRKKRR